MEEGGARLNLRPAGAGAFVVEVSGRLGSRDEGVLLDAYTRATTAGAERLILDLAAAQVDVGGLGLLVHLHAWCDARGQRLLAVRASALWREVLRVSRLDEGIALWATEAEALVAGPGGVQRPPSAIGAGELGPEEVRWAVRPEPRLAGRRAAGPLQGFGPLWEKAHRVRLAGAAVGPGEVVRVWRERFGEFWPRGNELRVPPEGLRPGEVVEFRLAMPGGLPLRAGGLVLYAAAESFALMTLEGHLQSGWITFGAFEDAGTTVAQVLSLARSGDPLYEAGFVLAGHREQEEFWHRTLEALARNFGVDGVARTSAVCVDARRQWDHAGNAVRNAGVRTAFDAAAGVPGLLSRLLHSARP